MPLANTLVRDKINTLSEQQGIPVVTFNTDITDANRIAYVGADNIASGRAAAALLGMVMQGHGSVLPILGQRSGHYADSQRFTGFQHRNGGEFSGYPVLHPECSFLDESLSERIAMRAIQSDSELRGIYLTSAGREGVYRAVHAAYRSEKLHIVVHDITEGNIKMVKKRYGRFHHRAGRQKRKARSRSACSTTTSSAISSPESA